LSAVLLSICGLKKGLPEDLGMRDKVPNTWQTDRQGLLLSLVATCQFLVKIEGQQKIKIIHTNQQSNLPGSCKSIFSLCIGI